jgi:membrane-bound inhibitor of C-type lysozyme
MKFWSVSLGTFAVLQFATALASDLSIHLSGVGPLSRKTVQYQCDAEASKLGLPKGAFSVEYINAGGNGLAVLPISGKSLIFVNVFSGSGARYVAQQYTWWEEAGRSISLRLDSLDSKLESTCHRVNPK